MKFTYKDKTIRMKISKDGNSFEIIYALAAISFIRPAESYMRGLFGMNHLEFTFEESPWEQAIAGITPGGTLDGAQFLAMMLSALFGCFQLIEGVADLFKGRFTLNTLL